MRVITRLSGRAERLIAYLPEAMKGREFIRLGQEFIQLRKEFIKFNQIFFQATFTCLHAIPFALIPMESLVYACLCVFFHYFLLESLIDLSLYV